MLRSTTRKKLKMIDSDPDLPLNTLRKLINYNDRYFIKKGIWNSIYDFFLIFRCYERLMDIRLRKSEEMLSSEMLEEFKEQIEIMIELLKKRER
ncbi:hypothetical protein CEE45_01615 [Candidatus Heimdallarchaeota archaeon B3_Heim]|nr:MAG: hypothetical protein CEE45_01615 [Candidatus Heimdallarchaeota archaeon B3_Heim]